MRIKFRRYIPSGKTTDKQRIWYNTQITINKNKKKPTTKQRKTPPQK